VGDETFVTTIGTTNPMGCLQFRSPPTNIPSMYQITEEHRARIAALCRRFHVRRLDLVGSATRGDFDRARSDLDFLVEFGPADGLRALDTYFGLKEELETLLGRPVDLIMPAAVANPYVRANMERDRTTLYAA
jgi:predicted nucleotidyltransferase